MNAPQPSYRPPTLPPTCDSCQYCPNCDPKPENPRHIFRFCVDHGLGRKFVELRDCAASGHECPPTAPLRRSAGSGQRSSNPRTAQIGQMPSPQPQHPQGYNTDPAYIYGNNPAGQYPEPRYRGHSHRPQVDQYPQVNGRAGFLFERMTAGDKAKAHWGLNYDGEPRFEGMQIYRDVNVGGESDTHSGNNYGLAHLKAGQQAKHADHFEMMDRDDFCNPP